MHTRGVIAYSGRGIARPRYYANDHSRDVIEIVLVERDITDARGQRHDLDEAGFTLVGHRSAIADFADRDAINAIHRQEIIELLEALSGADQVLVSSPGILRFSEKSDRSGALDNSRPARFAHVDVSDSTAAAFANRAVPAGCRLTRFAHYNVWRAISSPPQDVALAVCHAASVSADELLAADAVFDSPGQPEWSFEGIVVAYSPQHRWHWYSNMERDEVLVFKTHDSDRSRAHCVPHVAFDDPTCPAQALPRVSIEMRGLALWFA